MAYKRSKAVRENDLMTRATCPEPCGKVRYPTRAAAKAWIRRISGQGGQRSVRLRAYSGDESQYESCRGFFHVTSETRNDRTAFYRDRVDFARRHGLPQGWNVGVTKEGRRWRYTVYVPGEEPMPGNYTYATREVAEREAVADINGESRSA
jgi:hypothetical protein